MTETEKKALALVNEALAELAMSPQTVFHRNATVANKAICRAIEQHEAFKREVSSVCEHLPNRPFVLDRFIIAKPDPLVEVIKDLSWDETTMADEWAVDLRAALAARGLTITETKE